jgi:hypothetical protein
MERTAKEFQLLHPPVLTGSLMIKSLKQPSLDSQIDPTPATVII